MKPSNRSLFLSTHIFSMEKAKQVSSPTVAKKLFPVDSCWETEMSFLGWSDTGDIKHTPAQASCSGMFCQHKPDSMLLAISFPVTFF